MGQEARGADLVSAWRADAEGGSPPQSQGGATRPGAYPPPQLTTYRRKHGFPLPAALFQRSVCFSVAVLSHSHNRVKVARTVPRLLAPSGQTRFPVCGGIATPPLATRPAPSRFGPPAPDLYGDLGPHRREVVLLGGGVASLLQLQEEALDTPHIRHGGAQTGPEEPSE